jgi:hypothetical protein
MRLCFVCGSNKPCSHREIDLLPSHLRRIAERKISAESTALSTGFGGPEIPKGSVLQLFDPYTEEWPLKKPVGKAVDGVENPLYASNFNNRRTRS